VTKINSPDPPLPTVSTAYPTPPLPTFPHPPIELAGPCPCSHINLDEWIDLPAIGCGTARNGVRIDLRADAGSRERVSGWRRVIIPVHRASHFAARTESAVHELLERALDRQVMRQAAAVYQFRHADLQDRLADRYEVGDGSGMRLDIGILAPS
jgi:hypothetical protein